MDKFTGIQEGALTIRREDGDALTLVFEGKSILRDPMEFLQPILFRVLDEAIEAGTRLVLDFRPLEYMNSSTYTPLVKTLERARVGSGQLTVLYDEALKWQSVSFSALAIFVTSDGRVAVTGAPSQ